ncbi:hypothetical protein RclHR1_12460002 [Rhizophagus clarus]|uniref:F-box domain-containing protein n=1 Tax=Rhizophagus clarus TaxID=94130 RepID=A0A2Z6R067_9GLOM|nr:hypothetical protein RclHR1_12460002 [Rhizophagus clarus]GES79269.1 hypothetical protein GLOIN_2v1779703 [Rhizophagus clarus]
MAYSKLFSGDLPELINEVIQYFHHDYKTLHSCILVNRLWCRLTIPLLWEDPFSIKFPKNYRFIEIYLHNINDDDKTKLSEYGINNDLLPLNTLFNYPSFIKCLDTQRISNSIENWAAAVGTTPIKVQQYNRYSLRSTNLSSQILTFTKFVYRLIFQTFIENEVNLHSLEITMIARKEFDNFNEICELMLQNPNFICNIKNFKLDFNTTTENITKLLEFLHSNCNSISSLYFLFTSCNNNYQLTEKRLSQIINSQKNLRKILLGFNDFPLYYSLLSLKNPYFSNTLNSIIFYYVDFRNITVLTEVFNQLNVLESIHIIYCLSLDSRFIQQINNINKPFKLKSLFLDEILQINESLELLIQKSGNYLEYFGIINYESQQLLRLIIKYCRKIKFLGPIWMDYQNINLLFNLIENVAQNLNYLLIDSLDVGYDKHFSSTILQNLGQILPLKLEYLNLNLTINTSDFEIFLINSQNTFIRKLLISNIKKEENENIYPFVKEYIMKKKRVKYLAILESFRGKYEDLVSHKSKVDEFQLHDIQVLNYDDLFIDIYDFINFIKEVD